MLSFTNSERITSCVTACEFPMHSDITVLTDYSKVTYNSILYLYDCGKRNIALFGINPSSPHDLARLNAYKRAVCDLGLEYSDDNVFFTTGNISECVGSFNERARGFDAVVERMIFTPSSQRWGKADGY